MTRERAIEVLKAWDLNWSDEFTANEFEQAFAMAISALSAEGEYIKKEDLLNSVTIQDSPYGDFEEKVVTIEDIEKLPVYSFSERENDYMKTVRRDCGLYE